MPHFYGNFCTDQAFTRARPSDRVVARFGLDFSDYKWPDGTIEQDKINKYSCYLMPIQPHNLCGVSAAKRLRLIPNTATLPDFPDEVSYAYGTYSTRIRSDLPHGGLPIARARAIKSSLEYVRFCEPLHSHHHPQQSVLLAIDEVYITRVVPEDSIYLGNAFYATSFKHFSIESPRHFNKKLPYVLAVDGFCK